MSNVIKLAPAPKPAARQSIARAAASSDKPAKIYEVRADKPVGLLLRVMPSGLRTYYVQIGRGRRVRIGPAGTFTLEQARERAKAILLNPDPHGKRRADGTTLAEYVTSDYAGHAQAKLKSGTASMARVRAAWKPLLNRRVADITANEVDKLRNKRIAEGISLATVARDTAALSGVLAHWTKNTQGAVHPLEGLDPLDVPDDEHVRYLSAAESKRLRKALADRDAEGRRARASANHWREERGYEAMPDVERYCDHMTPMVLLSLNTGMRRGELFSLTWEAIDLRLKTIIVRASYSKANKARAIPLNAEALAVLQAIRPKDASGLVFKSPITGGRFNNVKKAWTEITKAAKVPNLRWHDMRHDFASQLVMRGVPLFTVQKLLGHSDPKMTQRYAKLAPGTLADAVSLLGGEP